MQVLSYRSERFAFSFKLEPDRIELTVLGNQIALDLPEPGCAMPRMLDGETCLVFVLGGRALVVTADGYWWHETRHRFPIWDVFVIGDTLLFVAELEIETVNMDSTLIASVSPRDIPHDFRVEAGRLHFTDFEKRTSVYALPSLLRLDSES